MEPVVLSSDPRGGPARARRPAPGIEPPCPRRPTPPGLRQSARLAATAGVLFLLASAFVSPRIGTDPGRPAGGAASETPAERNAHRRDPAVDLATRASMLPLPSPPPRRPRAEVRRPAPRATALKPVPPPAEPAPDVAAADPPPPSEPRRIRVRARTGKAVVARVHGEADGETHVLLPDGQLGIADRPAFADEPFRPWSAAEVEQDLREGPYANFQVVRKPHYLIFYQSSGDFAEESGRVLENLYKGLSEAFHKFEVPVHEAEFPLVAVIFRTEAAFRAHKPVAPEVQAYYEIYSNRIFFYETSERDQQAPEVAALRRPQTVAHEGTHQILQNIGIQPRLAAWPPWLVEGLAEYCATPSSNRKKGTLTWSGLGVVNSLHLATVRDLEDPMNGQVSGGRRPDHIGRDPDMPLVEYLVTKTDLTPTDYALAWALTHYLAMKRVDEFVGYLKLMSQAPPLQRRTPADHLAAFRAAFGGNLRKLDREVAIYLSKLKSPNHLPYYAVLFHQRVGGNSVKRAAIVSQSPSMIRQWLETVTSPRGEAPEWETHPFPRRNPALATAEAWVNGP